MDVTEAAKALTGCVRECRQRYGVNVIIETVHGADTAKIRGYRMNQNSFYGSLKAVPVYKLRQIMNELLMKNYLALTKDEYAVLRLTEQSESVLNGEIKVTMKMAREQENPAKVKAGGKGRKGQISAGREIAGSGANLFERLRSLRMEIARKEKVPPYLVFSDKTLTHMCILQPKTREEMLQVSGVGEYKFEKYGKQFLEVTSSWR